MRIGFDNDKYISMQAEHIKKRIEQLGGKLYLEFGGKLFDDTTLHAFFLVSSPMQRSRCSNP